MKQYLTSKDKSVFNNDELWNAKLTLSSVIHPDTNKPIFPLFRFSAFSVTNMPICILLLYPGGVPLQVFAQFVNQSYNVAVNYSNRNASNPISNNKLFISYLAAVSTSCGIAFSLRKIIGNMSIQFQKSVFARSVVPYTAIVLSSCLNLYFIRYNEISEGIELSIKKYNDNNEYEYEYIGKSKKAGHIALIKCCIARAVWSVPPLFFPPMFMKIFTNMAWFNKLGLYNRLSIEACVIGGILMTTLPPSLALFPQIDSIQAKYLENQFKHNYSDDTRFYFNKGL